MCSRNLHNCIHISIFVPWRIDIFAAVKHVNHGGEYGLEISTIFYFYGPKNVNKCELGPKNDVRYREVSAIKCPLHRGFVIIV